MSTEMMSTQPEGGTLTVVDQDLRTAPEEGRITVLVDLPHLPKYGHQSTRELVYGCSFAVKVGDMVKCPPTPLYSQWSTGVVMALDGRGYAGPVKFVQKIETEEKS